ncbi:hypothetical protein GH733_016872 [Mirounga leonina]|nr:hypothetical protein GH733_016872 [Mirounga leonina]
MGSVHRVGTPCRAGCGCDALLKPDYRHGSFQMLLLGTDVTVAPGSVTLEGTPQGHGNTVHPVACDSGEPGGPGELRTRTCPLRTGVLAVQMERYFLKQSDPDAEVCLHALRLVQSVVLEPEVFSKSASEFQSSLPLKRILAMAKSRNPHLQTVAQELLEDLRALERDA